jgi:ribosomal protein L13
MPVLGACCSSLAYVPEYMQVIVRCEEINVSGGIVRQKMKYERFLRKGTRTNPKHGQFHFRAPSQILRRTIRGCAAAMSQATCVHARARSAACRELCSWSSLCCVSAGARPAMCLQFDSLPLQHADNLADAESWHQARSRSWRVSMASVPQFWQPHPLEQKAAWPPSHRLSSDRSLIKVDATQQTASERCSQQLPAHTARVCSMVPHKTERGEKALERIKTYEGVPPPYDKKKRMVIPDCLQPVCLQHGHRYCRLADLSTQVRLPLRRNSSK